MTFQIAMRVENDRLHAETQQDYSALHSLIAGLPEPVLLVDQTGRLTFANQVAAATLGIGEPSQPLAALISQDETGQEIEKLISETAGTGRPHRMEILWKDGRIFDTTFAPVAKQGVAVCLHDITDLKHLDRVKSQLLATVSHDLKNPLALIYGFARLLLLEEGLSPEGLRCVQGILSGVDKMHALVNNLLDLQRIDAGLCQGGERSDVGSIVTGVVQDMQPRAAEKGQRLTVDIPVGLPPVSIAPLPLEQVVKNLVDNAIKYTQQGGHIHVDAEAHDAGVLVRVKDDGPGIPKSALPRLFERFFRVSTQATIGKEGSGLGLSIVRAIIEDCGGEVGVESEEGRGSIFRFWLPASQLFMEALTVSRTSVTGP